MNSPKKRWRTPSAKQGEIVVRWGRLNSYDAPDLCMAWGPGTEKPDARVIMTYLDQPRMRYSFPDMKIEYAPSLLEELEARGYDITTLKLTISKKT